MIDARRFICPPICYEISALFASFDFVPVFVPVATVPQRDSVGDKAILKCPT
jgi:hypothetical protein